ncbi:hypothetical protein [Pseudorhodobacter sp.]|uniref:hypothetical protein n=1 Tax=Pseudorhodobacter sp. TaxID=1934400 RepID=UPI0026480D0B|nr:hypothetical protein [Pseudorhodobacter sp.]MDN5787093.1 hypothetical protein [Pseudorhodobacter sp.]
MQLSKLLFVCSVLTACTQPVPDSGAGVGFGDYSDYMRQRDAAERTAGRPMTAIPQQQSAQPVFSTEGVGAAIDNAESRTAVPQGRVIGAATPVQPNTPPAQTGGSYVADRPRGNAPAGIKEESGEMRGGSAISDEQDFKAVSSRETIASDKERLAENRAQYHVVEPTALPQRTGNLGPSIVQFALSTTNSPGTQIYKRGGGLFQRDPLVTCAKYASPDLAQEAFLAKGGPQKDGMGLDPDGDGFACGWDPRPFRTALQ